MNMKRWLPLIAFLFLATTASAQLWPPAQVDQPAVGGGTAAQAAIAALSGNATRVRA